MRLKPTHVPLVVAVGLAAAVSVTFAVQDSPQHKVLFEKAKFTMETKGDLQGAIALFEEIVRKYPNEREYAAQALLSIGLCYEKLGLEKARDAYQRLIRDYPGQLAAVARARLERLRPAAGETGIVTRQVWTGPRVNTLGTVSTDGRFVSFADWNAGDLVLHDLATGTDRQLVRGDFGAREFAQESAISADGTQVAFAWFNKSRSRFELRVVGTEGRAPATPRVLHADETIASIAPHAWSPDGRWIAVQARKKDNTMLIGLVNAADGVLRPLKPIDPRGASALCFSPDGAFLAFDRRSNGKSDERDVFVMTVDGSREVPAVISPGNDVAIGWTPDGRHLLFSSDRGGSKGLWSLPWAKGTPGGEPLLIKGDINVEEPLGVTPGGALYYGVTLSRRDVYVAEIDATTGKILSPPIRLIEEFVGANTSPDWSPDGRSLAYVSKDSVLAIRSMDTGQTRELRPALSPLLTPRWAPDGRSLAAIGRDDKGRYGIHRVDVQTGTTSLIVEGGVFFCDWLPDGRKLVYRAHEPEGFTVFEYDIDSGTRRELVRGGGLSLSLSPDGRQLAYVTDSFQLMVVPVAGGEPREVSIQGRQPGPIGIFTWTPDGRAIFFGMWPSGDSRTLWLVAPEGGQPRNVDLNLPLTVAPPRFNPRTNQLAMTANVTRRELWVIEHFLPARK